METTLATEMLKTGETLTVACVVPPDPTHEAQIRPFLAHKPTNYAAHIDAAFAGQCAVGERQAQLHRVLARNALLQKVADPRARGEAWIGLQRRRLGAHGRVSG